MKRHFAAAEWEAVEAEIRISEKILAEGQMLASGSEGVSEEAEFLLSLAELKNEAVRSKIRHAELVQAVQVANHFATELIQYRGLLALAKEEGKLSPGGARLLAFIKKSPPAPTDDLLSTSAQAFYAWHRDNRREFNRLAEKI